jgi:tetratricopeptide (TPR) repeat protein
MLKHKIVILVLAILFCISQIVAQEWYKIYEDAKKEMERYDWDNAIKLFEMVIATKRSPNLHATTYGVNVIEYLPYFHLGQAYFYSGQYKKALENFQRSENFAVIKQTASRYSLLKSLKAAAQKLSQPSHSVLTEKKITEIDSILIGLILNEKYSEAISQLQNLLVGKKFVQSENLAKKDSIIEAKNAIIAEKNAASSFQHQFNQCLEPYLLGNYQLSLTRFSDLLNQYPQNYQAINWMKKIKSELDLLQNQKQPEIEKIVTEKIISQTASPVFLVKNPETVRSDKISIAGIVGDDNGIDRIEVTVNGVVFADQNGNPLKLQPSTEHNPKSFEFGIDNIPLQMGKNQITLIAFDVDSVQHSEFYPLTIIRKLPIYKTTTFYIFSILLLLFTFGITIISRIIKYRIAVVNKYNPYIAGAPILNEEMFFGRKQLLKSIMNTLHHNSLMIYGPRRIGKTSIQHQLKRKLENLDDPDYKYIPVYIDLQGIPEGKLFISMIEDIVNGCKNYMNDETELDFDYSKIGGSYDGRNFNRDLRKLITQLRNHSDKELRLVLLMDEVDELNSYSDRVNQRLRSVFMKSFAENLVAVMSGTHIRKKWESEGSPWYNFFEEIEIPPLRKEDAIALIKNPVKGIFSYDDLAIEKIIQYSQCYPYIIQKFCIYAINLIIEAKQRKVTSEDVEVVRKQVMED